MVNARNRNDSEYTIRNWFGIVIKWIARSFSNVIAQSMQALNLGSSLVHHRTTARYLRFPTRRRGRSIQISALDRCFISFRILASINQARPARAAKSRHAFPPRVIAEILIRSIYPRSRAASIYSRMINCIFSSAWRAVIYFNPKLAHKSLYLTIRSILNMMILSKITFGMYLDN